MIHYCSYLDKPVAQATPPTKIEPASYASFASAMPVAYSAPTNAISARSVSPPEWLAATGLEDFVPATPSYAAGENEHADLPPPSAVLISEIRPPTRAPGVIGLVEDRTLSIMRAIADGSPLPPILLYAAPDGAFAYRLGAGFHRFTISRALGFSAIPAAILTYWEPWMTGDPMP